MIGIHSHMAIHQSPQSLAGIAQVHLDGTATDAPCLRTNGEKKIERPQVPVGGEVARPAARLLQVTMPQRLS